MTPTRTTTRAFTICSLALACAVTAVGLLAQTKREVGVTAVKYSFRIAGSERAEIRVAQDDLVRITLTSDDIPHSFTLPEYRIQKRVEPGREVTFEFRAEKAGRFEFHCSMSADNCRDRGMVGTLIVTPR